MSKALVLVGGDECSEASQFVDMMDKFFDVLNVHNYSHGSCALKPFQLPYTSSEDPRLKVFYLVKKLILRLMYELYTVAS